MEMTHKPKLEVLDALRGHCASSPCISSRTTYMAGACAAVDPTTFAGDACEQDSGSLGKSSLVLRQQGGNLVGSYAYLEAGERKTASLAKFNCWQYGSLLNEKWHHVAFTVDQTVPELKVYADYQLTQTIALAGRLDFDLRFWR